jgi:hypothetical protein
MTLLRGGLIGACAFALLIVALSISPANSARLRPSDLSAQQRHELLMKYQPIVYYAADEWSPIRADTFTRLARVEELSSNGKWSRYTGRTPQVRGNCEKKEKFCFRFNLECPLAKGTACYRRMIPKVTNWSHGYVYAHLLDFPKSQELAVGVT